MNGNTHEKASGTALQLLSWLLIFLLTLLFGSASAKDRIAYFHNDALGSPVAATDEAGNVLWREDYAPYGRRLLKEDGGSDHPWYTGESNRLWYTGKEEESALGIQYYGARWYDASIGRFLQVDPAGFDEGNIHSFNKYAYANNNPYRYVDPDGRVAIPLLLIGLGIIADIALDTVFAPNVAFNSGAAQRSGALSGFGIAKGATQLGNKIGSIVKGAAAKSGQDILVLGRGTPKDLAGAADAVGGRVIDTPLRGKELYKHIYGEMRKSDNIIQVTDGIPSTLAKGQHGQWSRMEKQLVDNVDRLRQKTTRVRKTDLGLD